MLFGVRRESAAHSRAAVRTASFPRHTVDFARVIPHKQALLRRHMARVRRRRALSRLRRRSRRGWLEDYALFMALKDAHGGVAVDRVGARRRPARSRRAGARGGRAWRIRWSTTAGSSTSSSPSSTRSSRPAPIAASGSWATSPSTSRTTPPTSGPIASCSSWTQRGRPTVQAGVPPGLLQRHGPALGQSRSTTGMRCARRATTGGFAACEPRSTCSTSCASITSAASRRTGRCRAPRRPR